MNLPIILVADDEIDTRSTLKDYLSLRLNCKILEAADGNEVLSVIKQENVDIVLLDIVMPGISGIEIIKIINKTSPKTAIFAITKLDSSTIANDIHDLGAEYIPKPLTLKLVYNKIEKKLQILNKLFTK